MKVVSMTGFGSATVQNENNSFYVEIRTVNSRFQDFNFRIPHEYSQFENEIRRFISEYIKRGRIDVVITKQLNAQLSNKIVFNDALYGAYVDLYKKLLTEAGIEKADDSVKASFIKELIVKRDIVECTSETDMTDNEKESLFQALEQAVTSLFAMRCREGETLCRNILEQLEVLEDLRQKILNLSKDSAQNYQKKLLERISKLAVDNEIDPQRLATEVAIYADRVDITEELVRLHSHTDQILKALEVSPNGRTLDFLVQECGREFNTIASKAQSAEIQALAVSGKACLEKIREQIQNIE